MAMTTTTLRAILIMCVVSEIVKNGSNMFSFKNIYLCYKLCKKNKSNKINTLKFEANLLANLCELEDELNNRTYKISKSICFLAHSPKLREVFAGDFRDRIVHYILVKELEKFYEPIFIHDVYNNRKSKGIHSAVIRAKSFMNRHSDKNNGGYYLQLDIKGFFYNLDKNILFKIIFKDISNSSMKNKKEVLYLANRIIYHKPTLNYTFKGDINKLKNLPPHKSLFKTKTNKGIPIGNLTSQFFANIYMNDFDNFIKRKVKVKSYIRYVDDFVLFDESKDRLLGLKIEIEKYLKINLELNIREDYKISRFKNGLDFLGYIIRKDYLLVRNRVINNYKKKKAKFYEFYENGGDKELKPILDFLQVKNSFLAHVKHANSFNLIKKEYYV